MCPGRGILDCGTTMLNPLILVWSAARTEPGKRYAPRANATTTTRETARERFMLTLSSKRGLCFEFQTDAELYTSPARQQKANYAISNGISAVTVQTFSPPYSISSPTGFAKWFRIRYSILYPASVRPKGERSMDMPKTGEFAHIGKSVVIKGELSGSEDLYVDGKVEGYDSTPRPQPRDWSERPCTRRCECQGRSDSGQAGRQHPG